MSVQLNTRPLPAQLAECSICLTDTDGGVADNHGHVFHEPCIRQWIDHQSSTCPVCRADVTAINGVAVRHIRQQQLNLGSFNDILQFVRQQDVPVGQQQGSVGQAIKNIIGLCILTPIILGVITLLALILLIGSIIGLLRSIGSAIASPFNRPQV